MRKLCLYRTRRKCKQFSEPWRLCKSLSWIQVCAMTDNWETFCRVQFYCEWCWIDIFNEFLKIHQFYLMKKSKKKNLQIHKLDWNKSSTMLVCFYFIFSRNPCSYGQPHISLNGQITHCGAAGPSNCPATYWCHIGATLESSVKYNLYIFCLCIYPTLLRDLPFLLDKLTTFSYMMQLLG